MVQKSRQSNDILQGTVYSPHASRQRARVCCCIPVLLHQELGPVHALQVVEVGVPLAVPPSNRVAKHPRALVGVLVAVAVKPRVQHGVGGRLCELVRQDADGCVDAGVAIGGGDAGRREGEGSGGERGGKGGRGSSNMMGGRRGEQTNSKGIVE